MGNPPLPSIAPLEELFYRVSHDLSAPVRDIALLAEWIEADSAAVLSPECAESLRLMRNRIRRLQSAMADLLAYSRAPTCVQEFLHVHASDILHYVTKELAAPAFVVNHPAQLPVMHTSRTALREVFRHLLRNAVMHHDRDTGSIDIKWREHNGVVEWRVSDDGPGVAAADRDRIFEMFIALKGPHEGGGNGIGLALVKRLVELNGGFIRAEPVEPRGTCFQFTWPCVTLEAAI